jgi:hypothetical protein
MKQTLTTTVLLFCIVIFEANTWHRIAYLAAHHPFASVFLFSVAVTLGLDHIEIIQQSQLFWLSNGTLDGLTSGHINIALPPQQPIIPGMSL